MIARSALGDLPSSPPGALTSRHGSRRSPKHSLRLARSSRCLTWRTRSRKELAHQVAEEPRAPGHADPIAPCSDHARVSQGDPRSSAVDRSLPDGGASREQHAEKAGGITRLTFRATPGASPEPRRTSSIWMTASDHARRRSRVAGPPLREQTQQGSVLEGAPPARDAENFLTLQEG